MRLQIGFFATCLGLVSSLTTARAELVLRDDDTVIFFGNKVLEVPVLSQGMESFLRIRYPELKTRFRTFGRQTTDILAEATQRFEQRVAPQKPTILVLSFGVNDVPQRAFDQAHFDRFKADFSALVSKAAGTARKVYVLTPICPERHRVEQFGEIAYDQSVARYAEAMKLIAEPKGAVVLDWFTASREYIEAHQSTPKLAVTMMQHSSFPSPIGYSLAARLLLEAWGAEPMNTAVTLDWNGAGVSADQGSASVASTQNGGLMLTLSGMPLPWVQSERGSLAADVWPCAKFCRLTLQVQNAPPGGVLIAESGRGQPTTFLTEQLRQGVDLSQVGPLVKLERVQNLITWIKNKDVAFIRWDQHLGAVPPEPEFAEAWATYATGMRQYADATDAVIQRQPHTLEVTLELTPAAGVPAAAPAPPSNRKPTP